ncbi:MAG: hypothetical protein FWF54_01645 [Candidatus Azobacteroides sp.]|nr:hypothetical protein [Candidatus Azobacteroides sp.]
MKLKWYNYVACFFAGFILTNFIPHFVKGICGEAFPSPFASPPGKGLSSPMINVLWGLFNLVVGYLLFRAGKISNQRILTVIIFFIGIVLCGITCSISFGR